MKIITAAEIQKRMELYKDMKFPPITNPFDPMINAFIDALNERLVKDEIISFNKENPNVKYETIEGNQTYRLDLSKVNKLSEY